MNKVVINTCYGGYGLSAKALAAIHALKHPGQPMYFYRRVECTPEGVLMEKCTSEDSHVSCVLSRDFGESFVEPYKRQDNTPLDYQLEYERLPRHDKDLVKVVEDLGFEASGPYASLAIEEIDSDLYRIDDYDGEETVITPKEDLRRYIRIS